jgi:hypothetical protein
MKIKNIFIIYLFLLPFLLVLSCGQERNSTSHNASELNFLYTIYGGCNSIFRQNEIELTEEFKNDTVYYSVAGDVIKIMIGLRYICCSPFALLQHQENQDLFITLYDSCGQTNTPCPCRCICYYDFETTFSNYHHDIYYLKVYLHNPRQATDSLIHDIVIK